MNRERYPDPTAEKAIANVMREEKKNKRSQPKSRMVGMMKEYIDKAKSTK